MVFQKGRVLAQDGIKFWHRTPAVGIDLEAKVVANGVTHNVTATSSNPILPTHLFKTSGRNLRSFAGLSWLSARQYAIFFFADHR